MNSIFYFVQFLISERDTKHVCNVEPLFLPCLQGEDEVVVQTPDITQRVHHATDEEKLASTGIISQTTDDQEERGKPECNKAPAEKLPISDVSVMDGMFGCSNPPLFVRFKAVFGVK